MKIGILTQPLKSNYGGLLQAWALQKYLNTLGHDAWIIRRESIRRCDMPLLRRVLSHVKRLILIATGKRPYEIPAEIIQIEQTNTSQFICNRYGNLSPVIHTQHHLQRWIKNMNFQAYIVGSDQVWRPCYSPQLSNFFLDFCRDAKVKRMAYAASFGVDTWEFTDEQARQARQLIQLFDVVGVRENSAVKLCQEHLAADAIHVADPTLLLDRSEYEDLIDNPTCDLSASRGQLFCYVLDDSDEFKQVIVAGATATGYVPFFCNHKRKYAVEDHFIDVSEYEVPPVEQWLQSFRDAKMVITDSFHGCVFSIIFNKPFWVVANTGRGLTRITSLLSMFGLEYRLVSSQTSIDWSDPIDWTTVNVKVMEWRRHSCRLFEMLE